jgi:hypothetical protein
LARSSLALGTRETFLYVASLINFSKQLALFDPSVGGNFLGAGLQKIGTTLAAAKITPEDWKAAFGAELALLANWPESNHWPSLILTSPVKDGARARKIVDVFTHALDEDGFWKQTERNGAHYWSLQTTPYLLAIRPTVAVSNRVMVTGLDDASVEAAMRGSENPTSKLSNSDTYKGVARSVPAPTNFFAYVDTGLFYTRLDDTLRPMLLMSAAFMPWMNEYVDVNKLPPPEIVTKHLSPIVSSQRYHGNGYVAESVGPITLNQSGIGVGLLGGIGALGYKHGIGGGLSPWGLLAPPPSTPGPSGTP